MHNLAAVSRHSLDSGIQSQQSLITPPDLIQRPFNSSLSSSLPLTSIANSSPLPEEKESINSTLSEVSISSSRGLSSGYFVVGNSGQVGIDYLFDGGNYKGELGIFSLEGLDQLDLNSAACIQEIVRRVLSNSTRGHLVINDQVEGARFTGAFDGDGNFNDGDYVGVQMFAMNPGDHFGVVLLPNGSFAQILDDPMLGSDKQPLFSLVTTASDTRFQFGQIADVTGNGSTFGMEDIRLDGHSDRDYNDVVFQVRGALGYAVPLDQLVDPNKDWLASNMGQALLNYAAPYDVPKIVQSVTSNSPQSNQPLIGVIDTGVSANNPDIDYPRLILGSDRIGNDNNPLLLPGEGNEHGTHVLGTIGATQNNGIGIDGINDKAPIWVARAIGSGQWADSLAEFVSHHIASNRRNAVVNLSLDLIQKNPDGSITTRSELTPAERQVIEFARQHGIILVVSAGNSGGNMSALGQASQEFDNIITVGAANNLNRADYSSYGFGLDILAPGGTTENGILSTVGDGLGTLAGTSVATAQLTGAISLVWAANHELSYRQVIEIIKSTATDLNTPDWDPETGVGLLNIAAAVELAKVTLPQVHRAPASLIPDTWIGEGLAIPSEQAAFTGASWNGQVTASIGAFIRSGPGLKHGIVGSRPYNSPLQFDGWETGDFISYPGLGATDKWYRLAGTNQWISGAIVDNSPPSISIPTPTPIPTPNPAPIVSIDSSSANYRNGQRNPFAYNPALIGQCTWYAYGRMVETGLLPANSQSLFLGHAASWAQNARDKGFPVTNTPTQGARGLVVFPPGVRGAHPFYGHVAFLEEVYPDGRIRISESNWGGAGIKERILTPAQYSGVQFVQLENARVNPSIIPPPALPGQQQQYVIKSGDKLWAIAQRYLGNGNRWREITKTPSGETFTDAEAHRLQPGRSVYLPVTYQSGTGSPTPLPPQPKSTPESIMTLDKDAILSGATNLGTVESNWFGSDRIGYNESYGRDLNDYYKFRVSKASRLNLGLDSLFGDVDLQLLDSSGQVLSSSRASGTSAEAITYKFENPGDYYIRIYPYKSTTTSYNLRVVNLSGNIKNGDREYTEGVRLWRYGRDGIIEAGSENNGIRSDKNTIVVIHGNNPDDQSLIQDDIIQTLAKTAAKTYINYQILALDWKKSAYDTRDKDELLETGTPFMAAGAIAPVATWAKQTLESLGLVSNQINLFGHSLGSYVSAEIGRLFNKVNSVVALDPAFPATLYDINGNEASKQPVTNFRDIANSSTAFVASDNWGGLYGDNDQAATANDSFIVSFNGGNNSDLDYHGGVVQVFTNLLFKNNLSLSAVGSIGYQRDQYDGKGNNGRKHEGIVSAEKINNQWQAVMFTRKSGSNRAFWVGL
jgi:surface antigen/pimeloyl-ACP methyl ester carboxylesterase